MAHELLSIKLSELDDQIARLHHRIQRSETITPDRLHTEIQTLASECEENESIVRDSLQRSKAQLPGQLLAVYDDIETVIRRVKEKLSGTHADREADLEQKLLMAEYELDFAMLAVNRALLTSLEAIEQNFAYQTKGDTSHA